MPRRRVRHILSVAILIASALLPSAVGSVLLPAAASARSALFQVVMNNDGRCMQVRSGADNAPVIGGPCSQAESWRFLYLGADQAGNYYRVKNADNLKCLLVQGFGTAAGEAVQDPCLDYADQYWRLVPNGDSSLYKIVDMAHGQCLVLRSWQTQAEGSGCADFADQWWQLRAV